MIWLVATGLCLIVSAIGKAVMDTLRFHFSGSVFSKHACNIFVDPSVSWENKYRNGDPDQGERFPGSTTIFVFTTDLWHLSQFLFLRLFFAAIICYHLSPGASVLVYDLGFWNMAIDYVALSALFGATFTVFYSKIFKR
jgi:hypothetical protein